MEIEKGSELDQKAKALIEAAHEYWKELRTSTGGSAVIWLEDSDGRTMFFTRGEYSRQLRETVASFGNSCGPMLWGDQ